MNESSKFLRAVELFETDRESEARALLEEISPAEEPETLIYLSMIYREEQSNPAGVVYAEKLLQDYAEIVVKKAHSGEARWQLRLAEMHLNGTIVPQDSKTTFTILERLAEDGNSEAQYRLSDMYHTGHEPDYSLAKTKRKYWLELAADQGHTNAEFDFAELVFLDKQSPSQDLEKALNLLKSANNKGHTGAEALLSEFDSK